MAHLLLELNHRLEMIDLAHQGAFELPISQGTARRGARPEFGAYQQSSAVSKRRRANHLSSETDDSPRFGRHRKQASNASVDGV